MEVNTIDADRLKVAFLSAAKELEKKKERINELNVFPVPDGDTGTNMTLTILAAAREVAALENPDMKTLARAISSGSLRGARGNSGVILSQLLRGFTRELEGETEIDVKVLARAMARGTETAYKAVMKPKEGTILTVAKAMSDKAAELAGQETELLKAVEEIISHGDYVLSQTPEMLPVLKEAGVVDSGGQGLMEAAKGAYKGLTGDQDLSLETLFDQEKEEEETGSRPARAALKSAKIQFGYCTEFIINLEQPYGPEQEQELKEYLGSLGDSLVVVSDETMVKVHVHTNHPGLAFEKGLTYGSLSRMKVDNMREEHQERLFKEEETGQQSLPRKEVPPQEKTKKKYGFIAVAAGQGLNQIFKGIGADWVIQGGQTMNPSTEDLLEAVQGVDAEHIFILPNNKNIVMAARQAAQLAEGKEVWVVPSATVPQGITALVNFMPDLSPEENLENMEREMGAVRTAQITYAVRSTQIEGRDIEEGDIIGLGDQGLLSVGKSIHAAALEALKAMTDEDSELITIYYGSDVTEEDAGQLAREAEELFPEGEIDLQYGGQPVYYYLISAE